MPRSAANSTSRESWTRICNGLSISLGLLISVVLSLFRGGWVSPLTSEFYDATSGEWMEGPTLLGERKQGRLWRSIQEL